MASTSLLSLPIYLPLLLPPSPLREEAFFMERKRGADKPMVVKFYNEAQIRSFRSKHQRSSTVPMPTIFKKLPPSIGGSFTTTPATNNDALMIGGEQAKTFVLTLPDGSGYIK